MQQPPGPEQIGVIDGLERTQGGIVVVVIVLDVVVVEEVVDVVATAQPELLHLDKHSP